MVKKRFDAGGLSRMLGAVRLEFFPWHSSCTSPQQKKNHQAASF